MLSNLAVEPSGQRGPLIRADSIGKCYRIYNNPQDRFKQALLDQLGGWWPFSRNGALYRDHWALRDVSFELGPAQALGVVGRNGAGKSTLLQIIAGTLDLTEGDVQTTGRITALLELGSGFNFEFTGRENVFLNAQILGLSRDEAASRFDEIAGFADIGDFIDQPVKIYSSGMVMRLAFAVQTVLEPQILIVDEALGVGDARFQSKCFRKIRALRERGVAILLVSHDINAIISFCDHAILLDGGRLVDSGAPRFIAKRYMEVLYTAKTEGDEPAEAPSDEPAGPQEPATMTAPPGSGAGSEVEETVAAPARPELSHEGGLVGPPATQRIKSIFDEEGHPKPYMFGNKKVEILAVAITDERDRPTELLQSGKSYKITQRVVAHTDVHDLSSGIMIRNRHGIELYGVTNKSSGIIIPDLVAGQVFEVTIAVQMWLAAGDYFLQVAQAGPDGVQYDCRVDAYHFTVIDTPHLFTTSLVNLNHRLTVRLV